MTVKEFKLAIFNEEFTDTEVEKLLLDVEIEREKDISETLDTLEARRPAILRKFEEAFRRSRASRPS